MGLPLNDTSAASRTSADTPETTQSQASRASGAGTDTGAGVSRPKTEAELEADRLYEEAMEEAYAKREGGA